MKLADWNRFILRFLAVGGPEIRPTIPPERLFLAEFEEITHWDERWMGLAHHIAGWSKDRSRKIGCVIVDHDNTLVSMGWNGFPRGSDDEVEERHQRPTKYLWSEHAERNAIYNAARKGVRLEGCRMYLQFFSCSHCARAALQSGISEIICLEPDWDDPTYAEEFAVVREMLDEQAAKGRIKYRFMPGDPPVRNENV